MRIRESLQRFYRSGENYILAAEKFLVLMCLFAMLLIGEEESPFLTVLPILLIVSAACTFLPAWCMLFSASAAVLFRLFRDSYVSFAVGALLILIGILLYACFAQGHVMTVIVVSILAYFGFPFPAVMAAGLLMGPSGMAAVLLGTFSGITGPRLVNTGLSGEPIGTETISQILTLLKSCFLHSDLALAMILVLASFGVIYLIGFLTVGYSRMIAMICGILTYLILSLAGLLLPGMTFDAVSLAANLILGLLTGILIIWFCFDLDYRRMEKLQFEDDDYYYYVKAVPKKKTVLQINTGMEKPIDDQ